MSLRMIYGKKMGKFRHLHSSVLLLMESGCFSLIDIVIFIISSTQCANIRNPVKMVSIS